jgi:hypothetical protein
VTFWTGRGHRRPCRHPPRPDGGVSVLAEPAACDLTVDELRTFLADIDRAAVRAGTDPGHLRLSAAVRLSGAVKGIWVRVPARRY